MDNGKTENPTNNKLTDTTRNDVKGKYKFGYLVKMERKAQRLNWKTWQDFIRLGKNCIIFNDIERSFYD